MAATIFIHVGDTIDYIPEANVAAGTVVVQEDLVGVARLDIPAGRLGALAVAGVFDFPSNQSFDVGEKAYWLEGMGEAVADPGETGVYLGKVVKLNPRPGSNYVRIRMSQ